MVLNDPYDLRMIRVRCVLWLWPSLSGPCDAKKTKPVLRVSGVD